ncbi:MAG: hypothetical protein TREMPRED_000896 [Tremellales sp. Tagirdzhanova-0007]|nr:MAG: hypothetical protein TREMPRED_000896 [Tremellales sp. Tagirdzhanova-0007]
MSFRAGHRWLSKPIEVRVRPSFHRARIASHGLHTSKTRLDQRRDDEPSSTDERRETREALAVARAKAWYLDPPPHVNTPDSAAPVIPFTTSKSPRPQPQFTTFDPSRTTSATPIRNIRPLPAYTPDSLRPLHAYLTSDEAAEVLDPNSVVFMHTPSAPEWTVGPGELIRGESEIGARWEWVVVIQVRGTGKGVVGRAERAIRLWLHMNPLPPCKTADGVSPKLPRVPESTDWSMISPTDSGVCLNLFTGEGRERWDLEELWTGQTTLLSMNGDSM